MQVGARQCKQWGTYWHRGCAPEPSQHSRCQRSGGVPSGHEALGAAQGGPEPLAGRRLRGIHSCRPLRAPGAHRSTGRGTGGRRGDLASPRQGRPGEAVALATGEGSLPSGARQGRRIAAPSRSSARSERVDPAAGCRQSPARPRSSCWSPGGGTASSISTSRHRHSSRLSPRGSLLGYYERFTDSARHRVHRAAAGGRSLLHTADGEALEPPPEPPLHRHRHTSCSDWSGKARASEPRCSSASASISPRCVSGSPRPWWQSREAPPPGGWPGDH